MHRIPASAAKRWFVTGDVERSGKGHGRNKLGRCLVIWLLVMGSTPLPAAEEPPAADNRAADDGAADNRAAEDFFERHVRPVLLARCVSCHGDRKQEGGLRVDSREALLQGGDRGPALVPGDLASSLLWQAMERKGDLAMPPTGPLPATELAAVRTWIVAGAIWPNTATPRRLDSPRPDPKDHWAFQPLRQVEPPRSERSPTVPSTWVRTPVDAFILQKLVEQNLQPAPPADRRTLIRRLTHALTGLPPQPDKVAQFVSDPDPQAYEKEVERLLESPHYGEHWGRFWLDLARYSDTKGYVYAREERFWTHAWTYRDWVVRAFNENLPYDQFLLLQLAADQVPDRRPDDLAAMGYLTLGRRFLGVRRDVIDDRIDVVSRGTMGLTVSCARCHDHKYDPIPTADYYSLYGVFDSCQEQQTVLAESPGDEAFRTELTNRQQKLTTRLAECIAESSQRSRDRLADYLFAQTELHKFPADGFDQIFQKSDLLPAFVRQWEQYLYQCQQNDDPIFSIWQAYASLTPEQFAAGEAATVWKRFQAEATASKAAPQQDASPPANSASVPAANSENRSATTAQADAELATADSKPGGVSPSDVSPRKGNQGFEGNGAPGGAVDPQSSVPRVTAEADATPANAVSPQATAQPETQPSVQAAATLGEAAACQPAASELAASEPTASALAARARLLAAFTVPPQSMREVCDVYGRVFKEVDAAWQAELAAASSPETRPSRLADPAAEALRQVLYGDRSPCRVPEGPISYCETFFDSGTVTELWKLQGEVDRWLIKAPSAVPVALTLVDLKQPVEPRIFLRGNPLRLGEKIPRQSLHLLSGSERKPFQLGSGRLELARAIIDPQNPLTARVFVNRVWTRHFDRGLVTTPSDFGLRADPPSHPELLDWLAAEFIREGWDIKQLQRWIVLSSTFQQSSFFDANDAQAVASRKADPENRWLSRREPHRRTFEELRDAFLLATNRLDATLGGKPVTILASPFTPRRTLYGLVDRQYFPSTLRIFDFANPDLHVATRSETTVPQQALFFLNHPLVLQEARHLAAWARRDTDQDMAIKKLFQEVYQRDPSSEEMNEVRQWIDSHQDVDSSTAVSPQAADWQYGLGRYDEEQQRVVDFQALPHFTGTAWQGGPALPDGKLGWVQLTATGGHPGNDRAHAAVRRWVAPTDMRIMIESKLVHEPAAGDGIRAFIVSSQAGSLATAMVHKNTASLTVESREVRAGETIDFVVDIGNELNSDQFLWEMTLRPAPRDNGASAAAWNSRADFTPDTKSQLNAWEQLAHVLLCSNEFLFID
jgi:hypothetical protein